MVADALTKVVMIAGEGAESLLRHYGANALFVLESGDVWITPDWQDAVRLAA
jgi:thiamine biosynthesis lipoprotein